MFGHTTIEILNGLIRHHLYDGDAKIVEELIILRNVYCEQIGDPSDPGVAAVLSHRYSERVAQRSEAWSSWGASMAPSTAKT